MTAAFIGKLPTPPPDFVDVSSGVSSAGKPIKLDSSGKLGITMVPTNSISHGGLSGLTSDDHTQYSLVSGFRDFTGIVRYNNVKTFTNILDIVTKGYVDSVLPAAIDVTTGVADAGKVVKTDAAGVIDSSFLPVPISTTSGVTDANKIIKTNGAGLTDITFIPQSLITHSNIAGLTSDDHTIYSLASGGRDFTGVVGYNSSKTFTTDNDIPNKKYVDDSVPVAIDITTGAPDANRHVKTNSVGKVDITFIPQPLIAHSNIAGLTSDDHTIYSLANGTRDFTGIVQYNSAKTFTNDLDIIDKKYVDDTTVAINITTGVTDADKHIKTDASGLLDISFIDNGTSIIHTNLSGLSVDDHTIYSLADGTRAYTGIASYSGANVFSSPLQIPDVAYVDSKAVGLKPYYDEIRVASPEDFSTYVYNNGTVGVGAYLEAPDASSAHNTHDGVLLTTLDRVLVYNDTDNASENTQVTCLGDVAGSLNNKYFWLYSKTKSYYAWYNVSAGGSDPNPAIPAGGPTTKVGVEIAITTGDADTVVCSKSQIILNAVPEFNVSDLGSAVLQILGINFSGEVKNISAGNSGFAITLVADGKDVGYRNGVYKVDDLGNDGATKFKLMRTTDFDQASSSEITQGAYFFITEGSTNISTSYVENYGGFDTTGGGNTFTVGQTAITFSLFSRPEQILAGAGLSKLGTTMSIPADGVKNTMIDFGLGANQIDASDLPITDTGGHFGTHNVEAALQQLGAVDTNKFKTITTPLGTSPVADSTTDTLTLSGTSGVVTITGTALTDTIDFDIATDSINDTHIDFGTGANQVSAGDIPLVDTGGYYATKNTEFALQQLGAVDTNKFKTISVPSGVSPVANSTTDTLTLTSTSGDIAIVGTALTDTIDFSIPTDAIKDTHIDFGTGASQVSAVDIPILDAGTYTAQTEVEGALQELYGQAATHLTSVTHNPLDQLVHNIAETSYMEVTRTGLQVDSVIIWETVAKLKKIREELYSYTGENVTTIITKQYNSSGVLEETLTETITRNVNGFVTNSSTVLS